ncbi:hypothetical protein CKN73_08950 [Carnobacterium divergens]|uniref:hypothetical protein n=1 Tax=Carnobacterium divergens TaxID=2748 RepID=UPI0010721429|nr:hypothetical protein [Carnobacterium divergens]TFJ40432.1 hypothetical protein CKN77_09050 [Carnobacterium divergens]TFJ49052.1 hypothetical protein CKN73_08950 [Carnobacterium divergens]TFJ54316.1 hypothetical protein CKN83_08855 [Carnobacterium divergens]TFJ59842.1 hypothetical protein CKN89_09295 [Carnobacterium divergens]TFJ70486.1 hypothetical protein CKN91_08910 [Carnobacterium divergens]
MNAVLAFTIVMLIWTISDFVSKKTKSLLSSLLVASIIFLIGFKSNLLPKDILPNSSLLALGTTVVGFIIVHIGTMISIEELKQQWKTVVVGVSAIIGIAVALLLVGPLFESRNYAIAAIGAVSGGTISIIIVQEAALALGLLSVAVLPVLISALQGLIGFPLTSIILRKEAKRLQGEYRAGTLKTVKVEAKENEQKSKLPEAFQTTAGTLFVVGVIVLISTLVNNLTGGLLNTFIVALLLGVTLRAFGILKPNILTGIDAYGLMMLAILIIIFGPLATIEPQDLIDLIVPISLSFLVGVSGSILFAIVTGKLLGYSLLMSIAVGLTSLYGFPGTMILSQEAAKSIAEMEEERLAIEAQILPKMIIAGFSTVTITSVFITSILAGWIQ